MSKNLGAPSLTVGKAVTVAKAASKRAAPTHFPLAQTTPARLIENEIPNARRCEKCGKAGRVVSNHTGVSVHCACGYRWPISSSALCPAMPFVPARGFHKHTLIEPDWNAGDNEPSPGGSNESFGPRPRGK